jgi:hypothetical protein
MDPCGRINKAVTASGHLVIALYLHGHGPTRFLDTLAARSRQHPAIGNDAIALTDALDISRAVLAGYDWCGRAACGRGSARMGRAHREPA